MLLMSRFSFEARVLLNVVQGTESDDIIPLLLIPLPPMSIVPIYGKLVLFYSQPVSKFLLITLLLFRKAIP